MLLYGYPELAVSKVVLNPLFDIGDLKHGILHTQPTRKPMDRLIMQVIQNAKEIPFLCRGLVRGGMMLNLSELKQPVLAMHGQGSAEPRNREPVLQRLSQGRVGEGRQVITKKSCEEISADVRSINKWKSL